MDAFMIKHQLFAQLPCFHSYSWENTQEGNPPTRAHSEIKVSPLAVQYHSNQIVPRDQNSQRFLQQKSVLCLLRDSNTPRQHLQPDPVLMLQRGFSFKILMPTPSPPRNPQSHYLRIDLKFVFEKVHKSWIVWKTCPETDLHFNAWRVIAIDITWVDELLEYVWPLETNG